MVVLRGSLQKTLLNLFCFIDNASVIAVTNTVSLKCVNHLKSMVNLVWKWPGIGGYITKMDPLSTKVLYIMLPSTKEKGLNVKFSGHKTKDHAAVTLNGKDFFVMNISEKKAAVMTVHLDEKGIKEYLVI